jgi:hypothetical protein
VGEVLTGFGVCATGALAAWLHAGDTDGRLAIGTSTVDCLV